MSRKTNAVVAGQTGKVDQYNFLRDEAKMSAFLLASATSTLKLYIHDATIYFRGTKVDFTGGLTPVMSAPTASSRIDIVSLASSSEIVITTGVEADSPTAPTAPEDNMPICEVYNKAGQVEITDEEEAGSDGYVNKDLRKVLVLEKHASTTEKGIVEEATKAELNAGTDLGGSGAKLVAGSSILATSIYKVQLPSSDQKNALAGTGTPNGTNKYVTNDDTTATPTANKVARFNADGEIDGVDKIKDPMTYGEIITGATLAVPVYQDTSDNKVYACDANVATKIEFLGFAIENGEDTDEKYVQLVGIVKGFTGLDEGEKYYVQNTVGTIGKLRGDYGILVGRAISATELLIIREEPKVEICGDGSDGDVTISSNTTLTRDMYYRNLTVDSGYTLNTGSFRIFVQRTLTNNGTIQRNGNAGTAGGAGGNGGYSSPGSQGSSGDAGAVLADEYLGGGVVGKAGSVGGFGGTGVSSGDTGTAGLNGDAQTIALCGNGVDGVTGGNGGSGGGAGGGTAQAGGTGGTATVSDTKPRAVGIAVLMLEFNDPANIAKYQTGAGAASGSGGAGGGGASNAYGGTGGASGGSGSAGGIMLIIAKKIINTGTISVIGGAGGNGGDGGDGYNVGNTGGAGGGAGGSSGSGGCMVLVYCSLEDSGTISVAGGTAGTGGVAGIGYGTGINGSAGNNGNTGTAGTKIELSI